MCGIYRWLHVSIEFNAQCIFDCDAEAFTPSYLRATLAAWPDCCRWLASVADRETAHPPELRTGCSGPQKPQRLFRLADHRRIDHTSVQRTDRATALLRRVDDASGPRDLFLRG